MSFDDLHELVQAYGFTKVVKEEEAPEGGNGQEEEEQEAAGSGKLVQACSVWIGYVCVCGGGEVKRRVACCQQPARSA